MLELFAGKATVDQIARRLGVHASMWRAGARGGTDATRIAAFFTP